MKKTSLFLAFICLCLNVVAQEKKGIDESAFWGESNAYFSNQATAIFDAVDQALTECPPAIGAPTTRKMALMNLDALFHETKYDNSEQFKGFVNSRTSKVIADLAKPVKKGAKLYKVYNEGFVVRTKSSTVAIDLYRGLCQNQLMISDEMMQQIVDQCDILFITHEHRDHADAAVAKMFLDAGKQVVAPTSVWPKNDKITHIRPEEGGSYIKESFKLPNSSISVKIFPGHQNPLLNNIYAITTKEGITYAHVGDQYDGKDIEWLVDINKDIPKLDLLIVNCWTHKMNDVVNGFNPKLVVTAHENEMGHTIDHREAFWLTFKKMEEISKPYLVMGWGEWYLYK